MKKSFLGPNINAIGFPFLYLAASVLLFSLVMKIGVTKISEQRKTISESTATQGVLQQKESFLREVETEVSDFVDASANAIPEKNPALTMIAQLKNLAVVQGLTLTSFKVGSDSLTSGVSSVEVTFGVDGTTTNVLSFIQALSTAAPISSIEKAKVNTVGGIASANVSLKVYFAEYPTKLPALTEPISTLSAEERTLLDTLSALTLPSFTKLNPQEPGIRGNPFE